MSLKFNVSGSVSETHASTDKEYKGRKVCFYSGTNYDDIIKKTEYHCRERPLFIFFSCVRHLPDDGWSGEPKHVVACNKRLIYYIGKWAGIAQSVWRLVTGWTLRGSNPGWGEIFRTRPDQPWGPPSLLYNGYWVFPGVKRPDRGVDHPTPSIVEDKERVELYLYSPSEPLWPVLGWPLPLFTRSVRLCLVGYLTPYWQERHNGTVSPITQDSIVCPCCNFHTWLMWATKLLHTVEPCK
jgi:hypothetical protein